MANLKVITSGEGLVIKSKAGKKALKKAYAKLAEAGIEKSQATQLLANLIPVNLDEYDQETVVEDGAVVIVYGDLDKDDLKDAIKTSRDEILEAMQPEDEEEEYDDSDEDDEEDDEDDEEDDEDDEDDEEEFDDDDDSDDFDDEDNHQR